jgi:myo-inositol-1(or 4)-monophosphatase
MSDADIMAAVTDIVHRAMAQARTARIDAVDTKSHQDFVTNIDMATDAFLEAELGALIPDCPVLSEERAVTHRAALDRYWIVDPIDGTLNMMAGLPFYAVAVCLVDADGPLMSAIGAVAQNDVYTARRGGGAWLNDVPLRIPDAPPALVVPSTGLLDRIMADHPQVYGALRKIGKIRNFGAQALHLAQVARGGLAAVASIEAKIWDEVAAGLILREAGGVWTSAADAANWRVPALLMEQAEQRSVAAHPNVAQAMQEALKDVFSRP